MTARVSAERTSFEPPSRTERAPPPVAGRVAYALLFSVVLPVLLVTWARRLDALLDLPALGSPLVGTMVALSGLLLIAAATRTLWIEGRGLPASPFPPQRLATGGAYRIVAHPIYAGAVALSVGVALATRSPAGVWIVSPVLALAAAAWVLGFERDATRRRFGAVPHPRLRLPVPSASPPTVWDRTSVYLLALAPWLVLYMAVEMLGAPRDARSAYMRWEQALPVIPWTEIAYASTYLFVALAPLVARRARELRELAVSALVATAIIIPIYLLIPLEAVPKPIPGDGFWQTVLRWERAYDAPITAFPAFHVVWALLAARVYASARPRWGPLWWLLAAAMAASTVTTGMHAVLDVVAGVVVVLVVATRARVWRAVRGVTERIANSWRDVALGRVRLLSHGAYAAIGAVVGVAAAVALAGPGRLWWIVAMTLGAIAGAALWAQGVEGSPTLLRPFGYFGSVVGVGIVTVVVAAVHRDPWVPFVAFGAGSTLTYAFGRLRCLVQGCCHGRPASPAIGIVYAHPCSRVVRLSAFGGVPIHATQLHSAAAMLAVGAVMLRLWFVGAPLSLIAGAYFIGTGLSRFVEEHYRGEPQTPVIGGLRLYQWLSIGFVVVGAVLTTVRSASAPAPGGLSLDVLPVLAGVALIVYVAYGVDWPGSARRFSRLT